MLRTLTAAVLAMWVALLWATPPSTSQGDLLRDGEYIFHAAGCAGCHTKKEGPLLAGGLGLKTSFGTFYAPNITPEPNLGIGRWSDEDFIRAIKEGVSPDGEHYYPVFPYTSYTYLSDGDVRALKAYLFTLPPVPLANKPHELPWYLRFRSVLKIWKMFFFSQGPFYPQTGKPDAWNRGAYLTQAVTHCGECHTPRNMFGGIKEDFYYAGNRDGADGEVVPNITPNKGTGIGWWSQHDLIYYLETGATPDGDFAGGLMADVIDNSLRYLRKSDLAAMANYVLSLPPIEHSVQSEEENEDQQKGFE